MSDMTVAAARPARARAAASTWAGPLACDDFGRERGEGGVDDVTEAASSRRCRGALEAVGFRTDAGFDGLDVRGTLWGGNLCDRQLAARRRRTGRASRAASSSSRTSTSIRTASSATCCSCTRPACSTRRRRSCSAPSAAGASRRTTAATLADDASRACAPRRARRSSTGLPFGHVPTKVTLPVGAKVRLLVDRRQAFVGWALTAVAARVA